MGSNVISVSIDQLPEALAQGDDRIRQAVVYGCTAGAHRGRAIVVRNTPTDMGNLKGSWKVKERTVRFSGSDETIAELVNDAPHISVVELGARPHPVNPAGWAAIYEWVRRHYRGTGAQRRLGGSGRMKPRGAGIVGPFKGSDPDVSAITNAIVWKIRKYGQRATLFVRNSMPELQAVMAYELDRAIARAQADIARGGGK